MRGESTNTQENENDLFKKVVIGRADEEEKEIDVCHTDVSARSRESQNEPVLKKDHIDPYLNTNLDSSARDGDQQTKNIFINFQNSNSAQHINHNDFQQSTDPSVHFGAGFGNSSNNFSNNP